MDARLDAALAEHPRPLLFVTVSGAHLYGFPSPDSDYDLRGVHLMRTGEVQANLVTLNDTFGLDFLPDLIARKLAGPEKSVLTDADVDFHRRQCERLRAELEAARDASDLPERATATEMLDDLLVRTRLTA